MGVGVSLGGDVGVHVCLGVGGCKHSRLFSEECYQIILVIR